MVLIELSLLYSLLLSYGVHGLVPGLYCGDVNCYDGKLNKRVIKSHCIVTSNGITKLKCVHYTCCMASLLYRNVEHVECTLIM